MTRLRTWFNVVGPLAVIALLLVLDPDSGLNVRVFSPGTTVLLLKILSGLLLVSCAFWTVKILLDYPEADTRALFIRARQGCTAAGLALIARILLFAVVLYAFASSAHASTDVRTYIPAQARTYAPMLHAEQARFWVDHPRPEMLAGLVEQESCLSLTHSKCWNPSSRLKTLREEGAGFGQITRAYRADGSERFDALAEMRSAHSELRGLTWDNVYQSPDLQLRAIVLKVQDDFKSLDMVADPRARLDFADAAYSGGRGGVQNERRACGLKKGCDPQQWFGHVELAPDALITDATERKDGPDINAVYVSGTTQGMLSLVKRTGSAADKLAVMVTDPLLTATAASRQRGLSILGAAGNKYNVILELPVLTGSGQPGVIDVGQLVQVNAATPWRGRVRAVSVAAKRPSLRQTITLERHLETV